LSSFFRFLLLIRIYEGKLSPQATDEVGQLHAACNTPLLFAAASCKIDIILRFLNGNQEDHHAVD